MSVPADSRIRELRVSAYRVPTDAAETDGTLSWGATTLILVELDAANQTGIGYTYADASLAALINGHLRASVEGQDALAIGQINERLWSSVRNLGRSGLAACAISAIDTALWDLKARLLNLPLAQLLGLRRDRVAVYGSGGFINYDNARLSDQLASWVEEGGCSWIKMKVSADAVHEARRVQIARAAVGDAGLFIDANGAHSPRSAIAFARRIEEQQVSWFEEPVSSDDVAGLHQVRQALDASGQNMDVAAGEYGYTADDFRHLLEHQAVDVLQADVTRCGGVTGFMQAAALCDAFHLPLSAHCAPALHLHLCCAAPRLRHQEWFHDHVRLESMLFEGVPQLLHGHITPDLTQPGHGLRLRRADAQRYAA
ncbi:MAG: enolase C-terminal domain-like protein [Halopseudomonas sp.]|uniref:enolase C-terminal domain-like protein n=1 Tax=Halopseudomonas sp. TaxID=2901191 RepID=UPI00300267ED